MLNLKTRFRIALAASNQSQSQWARRHHITDQALSQTLTGRTVSRRITTLVVAFIDTEFRRLKISIGTPNNSKHDKDQKGRLTAV